MSKPIAQQSWPQLRPVAAAGAPTTFCVEFSVAGIEEKFQYELAISDAGPAQGPEGERLSLGE